MEGWKGVKVTVHYAEGTGAPSLGGSFVLVGSFVVPGACASQGRRRILDFFEII